jgi:phosphomannomutase
MQRGFNNRYNLCKSELDIVQGGPPSVDQALDLIAQAHRDGTISSTTVENAQRWISDGNYEQYRSSILQHIADANWRRIEEVFWSTIPFGTAGRRGTIYPFGTQAINTRTIGETVQALADYLLDVSQGSEPRRCAVAFDTRHNSAEFARLSAEIMAAAGFAIYFFDQPRSTPCLATTVLHKQCDCGIMITASHNPPTDNAIKVFWSNSGQLLAEQAEAVWQRIQKVGHIRTKPFDQAVADGEIEFCREEMDEVYRRKVFSVGRRSQRGTRDLVVVYSPLQGVGGTSVPVVLADAGFENVEVFGPHAEPSADFPNVPGGIANPEDPQVFQGIIQYAKTTGADLILASDPDADRLGCATPLVLGGDDWRTLSGNEIGVLIADYLLDQHKQSGALTPDHYVIKTLVTSNMVIRVAAEYGVRAYGDVFTGFKWIGALIDELGPDHFVFGFEEAHGYLAGTHCRDKDGAVAALLLAELADQAKSAGLSVHQKMNELYRRVGCHLERTSRSPCQAPTAGSECSRSCSDCARPRPPKLADRHGTKPGTSKTSKFAMRTAHSNGWTHLATTS